MKVIEVIDIHRELLKFMQKAGIRLSDVSYIELYEDYQSMTRQGLKVTYIVAYLSVNGIVLFVILIIIGMSMPLSIFFVSD